MKSYTIVLVGAMTIIAAGVASAPALGQSADEDLAAAIELFNQNQYDKAHEALVKIDPEGLSEQARSLREQYLERAKVARNYFAKAVQDRKEADKAFDQGQYDKAELLYRAVLDNEYANKAMQAAAQQRLAVIVEKRKLHAAVAPKPAQPSAPPTGAVTVAPDDQARRERAEIMLGQAREAAEARMWALAIQRCESALVLQPDMADARSLLAEGRQMLKVSQQAPSLMQRIRQRNQILWQKAVAEYRGLESRVRDDIVSHRFDQARQNMQLARQTIEAARRYSEPATAYEDLVAESESLAHFISEEQRRYEERRVREQLRQIEQSQAERRRQTAEAKAKRVSHLMDQARLLAKQQRYADAISDLKDLLAIDETNEKASFFLDVLQDRSMFRKQGDLHDERMKQARAALVEVDEARIPWHKDIMYPKDWLEITEKRRRYGAAEEAEPELNRAVRRKLRELLAEINFQDTPLESAVNQIRSLNDINIQVNWNALEFAGIDRDTAVTARLRNISLEKALQVILDDAEDVGGGGIQLGYVLDEGVLTISTEEDLQQKQITKVYDIRDLLVDVPQFTDPATFDLGDAGGGGGGGGAGGGVSGADIFGDISQQAGAQQAVDLQTRILEIINNVVAPDTWIQAGGLGSLDAMRGMLIVTNSPTVHREMVDLLQKLREPRAIQIAVEARFISVTSNFFEELGVDLDVVLNAGNAGYDRVTDGTPFAFRTDPATGSVLLIPRQNSRLGFLPNTPGLGLSMAQATPFQPYTSVGLVPAHGQVAPHSGQWTPLPLMQSSQGLVQNLTGNAPFNVPGASDVIQNALANPALNIFGTFLDNLQVDFLIRATQVDQRSSILTAPRIVLFNGQDAWIAVQEQQAYVSDLQAQVQENVGVFEPTISTTSTGTQLRVQGTVSADRRYVTLTLQPVVSRLIDMFNFVVSSGALNVPGAQVQLPLLQVTGLATTVSVPDGGTLLIGGQKLADETEIEAGVPLLSKIPLLKRAFSNRSLVKNEQTLLILVKPTIIIQTEQEEEAFPQLSSAVP